MPREGAKGKVGFLARANVVLLVFNLVAAVLLVSALWRIDRSDRAAEAQARGGRETGGQAPSPVEAQPDGGGRPTAPIDGAGEASPRSVADAGPNSPPGTPAAAGRPADRFRREPGGGPGFSDNALRAAGDEPVNPGASPPPNPRSNPARPGPAKPAEVGFAARPAVPPTAAADRRDEPSPAKPEETPPAERDPASDRTPPVLDALAFDPPQIADGSATTLVVRVHDDLAGVKRVTGNVRSPSGKAMLSFEAQGAIGGNVFTAGIAIPEKAETGLWYVSNLYALDAADNTLIATYTAATVPAGGTVQVYSRQSDSEPPVVIDVSVEKPAVGGGEKNRITVEVEDRGSGVGSVWGQFQSASQSAQLAFAGSPTADPDTWSGEISIPANADCGNWNIQQLRVTDKAGNSATLSADAPQLARVGFYVSSRTCDSDAPTLEQLTLSPYVVSNETASEIRVTAEVRDEGTGTSSVIGWVSGPVSTNGQFPKISFVFTPVSRAPDALWTAKILVPQYAAKGTWRVGLIRLQDGALNTRDYRPDDPVIAGAVFEVQ